jgi:hypothetical protein
VLGDVRFSFGLVPFESHRGSVHTECMYVKFSGGATEGGEDRLWLVYVGDDRVQPACPCRLRPDNFCNL